MKKMILSLVAAMLCATATFAQSSLLATLSHDGTISTFYGASALKQAHNAAANGDIITLSSGSFTSVNITKAITLRGAGWEVDTENHSEPSVISGEFTINIPTETTERLTIEGVYHNANLYYNGTLKNATFLKSRFKSLYPYNGYGILQNATFIHCRISDGLTLTDNCSAICLNSVIWWPNTHSHTTANFECVNCVLYKGDDWSGFFSSTLKSCILVATADEYAISSTSTLYNNICVSQSGSSIFQEVPNSTNKRLSFSDSNPFATYTGGDYNDSEKFELTEEAKTKYLGLDGTTQVGIYGGTMPFSSTPSNPQIKKCNVAAKSTADGKLSVDIEVSSAE